MRGPLTGLAVRLGHVGRDGRMARLVVCASMAGDPLATMETLNGMAGDAHIQLLFDQRVGHGVVVTVYLDVIVDVYAHLFPLGIYVGFGGQGLQGRSVQLLELLAPGTRQFLEGPIVELRQQFIYGTVQGRQ